MENKPKNRSRIIRENQFHGEKDINTLKAGKAGDYVPSLNKINKENNPM